MKKSHILKTILPLLFVLFFIPASVFAQGTHTESFSLTVAPSQVEQWLGNERRITHPVIQNLEKQDSATLHFYFTRAYGQRAEAVIATAQSAREKTLRFLPPETVADVHVYLLPSINQYFDALGSKGRGPDWASGLTLLGDNVILIRLAPNGTTRIEPERTLAHELNHVALHRYSQNNYFPHWFYEGLAMTSTNDWSLERAESLGKSAMAGQILPLEELDVAFSKNGTIVDLAYAESAHFVSWLVNTHGDEAMKSLLKSVSEGTPFDQAFTAAFGRSPKAAHAIWKENMSRGENILASLFSHDGLFFMISLFAAIALCIALWHRTAIRKRRMAAMNRDVPDTVLPENLRHFGPFN
ncbi:MAG: hypothetical protein IJU23_09415 [Proteobacteria bacterium]|nr:hypothetical protein [Pseudomonadota bacterium]